MAERQALGIDIDNNAGIGGTNYELFRQHMRNGVADFLIIKAGKGHNMSPPFNEQRQNSEQLGIPYVTYFFLVPDLDPRRQAQKYVDWVGTGDRTYMVDLERSLNNSLPSRAQVLQFIEELDHRTGKKPVIYTRMDILKEIGFLEDARQFRLWIAEYLSNASLIPKREIQYKFFDDFTRDYSNYLPPTAIGTPLEDNVILWQFSEKGIGPHYIYNWLTEKGGWGKRQADLNISIQGREAFMQDIFGTVPTVENTRATEPLDQLLLPTYPDIDNQAMLDIFFEASLGASPPFTKDPWNKWIVPAQLEYLAIPTTNRKKPYTGPRIEDLPGLSSAAKQAILALIHPANNKVFRKNRTFEGTTNHDMINLILRAALPLNAKRLHKEMAVWREWIVPAGLESLGVPRSNRGKPYTGLHIEDLPNLTAEQKNTILARLASRVGNIV